MAGQGQRRDPGRQARGDEELDSRVAIIGMACRFPGGAASPAEFWKLLSAGVDATVEVPADRWDLDRFFSPDREVPGKAYVRRGGFLRQRIDQLDASFFGISSREAALLDPQQRLLLEVTWEALEDRGILPGEIRGSNTGVYIGGFTMDNQIHLLNVLNRDAITTHTAISSTTGMLSNRLSYTFDLRGPSMSVDTACSSSLVALHLACQALRLGECELAVTGGVNVMLRPEYTIAMCRGGFLSPDGLCKAFDASGDGYARGEGAGVLILKPLPAALRDGDRIRAVIVGTGVNQDGRTDGITVPSVAAQKALIREVQSRAGVAPDDIQYVEAHGTGTQAGDTAEATSLGEELAVRRSGQDALWMGSVKTNIGHLEAAAGVAGIIKTVLALEHRLIPPNLHFRDPHPAIDFAKMRLRIPTRLEAWPEHSGPAYAAVNSFGYGGTNAHAILAEAPPQATESAPPLTRPVVFPISAASDAALATRVQQLAAFLETFPDLGLADLGFTAARRRTHHSNRLGVVVASTGDLARALRQVANGNSADSLRIAGPRRARSRAKVAFVYAGMGPQFYGMGMDLLEREPAARELFARCDRIWCSLAGWPLAKLFAARPGEPMAEPEHAQPANFVHQLMVTEVARSYGLCPEGVVGHSVGEIAAACVSGSLSLEDALMLTYHRSRLQQRLVGCGKMLAVGLSLEEAGPFLRTSGGRATIAAINSPTSVTVAGDSDVIVSLNELLTAEGIFSRILKVAVPYHSYRMDPLAPEFESSLARLVAATPTVPSYSTVTGAAVEAHQQDVAYWWRNARQPVRFADAVMTMIRDGFNTFVEVGSHPVLTVAVDACLRHTGVEGDTFALQQRNQPGLDTLLATIAGLYTSGATVDWSKQYPCGKRLSLPAYPWDRETLWSETEASRADRLGRKDHPLLVPRLDEAQPTWEGELSGHRHRYLADHRVQDEAILPAAAFVEMGLVAKRSKGEPVAIEGLRFHRTLAVDQTPIVRLHLDSDGARFNIYSRTRDRGSSWTMNASGRLLAAPAPARAGPLDQSTVRSRCPVRLDVEAFYRTFASLGLQYGPAFRCLREAVLGENEILSRIAVSPDHAGDVADYYLHPTLLDAALQTLLALRVEEAAAEQLILLPVEIAQVRFQHKPGPAAWCHASLTRRDEQSVEGDLVLYDDRGEVGVELLGLRARTIRTRAATQPSKNELLYRTEWHRQTAKPGDEFLTGKWLVFCDAGEIGAQLVRAARARRVSCVTVRPGAGFKQVSESVFEVARESRADIARVLTPVGGERLDGVVYLWGLDIAEPDQSGDPRSATGTVDVIDLLHVLQEVEQARNLERVTLCIATVRSQAVTEADALRAPGQHALLGVGRVVAIERPQLRLKMIDLNSRQPVLASTTLLDEILSGSDETEVAFRSGVRYVPRLVQWREPRRRTTLSEAGTRYALKVAAPVPGDGLEFHETEREAPEPGEVEIAVQSCAVERRDDVTTDVAPPVQIGDDQQSAALDSHVAGVVVAVGHGVTGLRVDDEVVVLTPARTLTSHVTVAEDFVVARPSAQLPLGATLLDWAAAYYALFEVGKLEPGQSVLIHPAETGIGQAAIQLAKWRGADVFATTTIARTQDGIRRLGVEHVSDTRSLRFVDDVVSWTGGRGVDVVLSSVSGEIREKALGLVAAGGRFLDISARSGHDRGTLPVAAFDRGLDYAAIDLARLGRERPHEFRRIMTTVESLVVTAGVDSMGASTYPVTQVDQALQALTKDDHIGRVLVDLRQQRVPISRRLTVPIVRPDAGYLVTGGFGGFGLETLKWLVASGARNIAVLSRSGPVSEEAKETVRRLEADGARILVAELDISDGFRLAEAIRKIEDELPPLRGVIHSAAVIDDAALDVLQASQVERVMNPKAVGAWNLNRALANRDLDFFVCYSSITAMLGNAAQANYAAANAFLDGLVLYRRSRGLAGVSINWGVISDVGMVSRDARVEEHLQKLGLRGITSALALELLADALREQWVHVGVFDLDWQRWRRYVGGTPQGRFSRVLSPPDVGGDLAAEFRRRVITARPDERFQLAFTEVAEQVCRVLRIPSSRVDAETNLTDLGIDSLMATEVAAVFHERTGVRFRVLFIVRGPAIAEMARQIVEHVVKNAG